MKTLIAFLLITLPIFAEGIPLDEEGNLTLPHTVVRLNASQIEEAETLDSVTLTKEQWARLRKVSQQTPKRLNGLIPIDWNDCTCGVGYAAIQLSRQTIAVPHSEQTPRRISLTLRNKRHLKIHVDSRAQFYLDGVLIHYERLKHGLKAMESFEPSPQQENHYHPEGTARLILPFGMSPDDAVFENRLLEIYSILARKGWNGGSNPLAKTAIVVTE